MRDQKSITDGQELLEKVGEHKSFDSSEEYLDSSDQEANEPNKEPDIKNLQTLESEFD